MPADTRTEIVRSYLASADSLIQSLFILNGAAAAGLLTFVGNTIDKQSKFHSFHAFSYALMLFSLGLVCVLVAGAAKFFALNYSTQIEDTDFPVVDEASAQKVKIYLFVTTAAFVSGAVAAIFCLLSLAAFAGGIWMGRYAIFG